MTIECDCIELEKLSEIPVLPDGGHWLILQKCIVCLEHNNHNSPVSLENNDFRPQQALSKNMEIKWSTQSTDQWRAAHADLVESVEDSAKVIAFLFVTILGYQVVEQSLRGTRVDYFVSIKNNADDNNLIFNDKVGLEISGILNGPKDVKSRLKQKKDRIKNQNGFKPSLVVVVEHSKPHVSIDMVR